MFGSKKNPESSVNGIVIEHGLPLPIRKVNFNDQLQLMKVLEKLPKGSSFKVNSDLRYAVQKISKDHFPEYKISIRSVGDSYRAYRVA